MARWFLQAVPAAAASRRAPDGAVVVRFHGYLDEDDVPSLREALVGESEHLRGAQPLLFCDLRGLRRPDVATVGALARLKVAATSLGWDFELGYRRDVWELIALLGMTHPLIGGRPGASQRSPQVEASGRQGGSDARAGHGAGRVRHVGSLRHGGYVCACHEPTRHAHE